MLLGANRICFAMLLALAVSLAAWSNEPSEAPYNPYAKLLADANIEPQLADLTSYLHALVPSEQERAARDAKVVALIAQLGNPNFALREAAMRDLVALPDLPQDKLRNAAESDDPEVRWRSELVLKRADRPNPLPEAVCRTIAILKISGAAPTLLHVMPELDEPHVRRAAEAALIATATRDDEALLRKSIASDDSQIRAAAVSAYAAAMEGDAAETLLPLLKDENTEVKLAAIRGLANLGERAVLPVLLNLLEHEDVNIRANSVAMLRGLTEQHFGFLAYDDADKRAQQVAAWRKWIAAEGRTADLNFPLQPFAQRAEIGHTIILLFQQHKAIELNAAGETIWEKGDLGHPWAVQRLANGNTIIGSYRGKYVVEFDREGNEVWRKDGLPGGVFGLQRLANGNTLLGLHSAKKVIEINQAGKTVWEATFNGQPMGLQRLANGNTVIALHSGNKVVEVNPAGEVIWEVNDVKIPRTVQRLDNGNTLVGDSSNRRAVEFDPDGKVVWSHTVKDSVYDARRLTNGNTLISGQNGVRIVNPEGEIVWEKKISGAGRALRF